MSSVNFTIQHASPRSKEEARTLSPRSSFRIKRGPLRTSHFSSPTDRSQRFFQRGTKKAATIARDEYDSDSTVDLDDGSASHLLRGTTPLRRMTSDYERLILRSISQGKSISFACACSLAADKRKVCPKTDKLNVTTDDKSDDRCQASSDEDSEEDFSGSDHSTSYDDGEHDHFVSNEKDGARIGIVLRHHPRRSSP